MSVAKKLLLILEMNQVLVYVHNNRTKFVDFALINTKIQYNDSFSQFDFLYRPGKNQLLQYIFSLQAKNIDIAIWSNLDNQILLPLCQKYFGRYFRQLLFVMGTNRALYAKNSTERHEPLKIKKELDNVFHRFPGYTAENTLVLSTEENLVQKHTRNNLNVPAYNPKLASFSQDVGGFAIKKYLQGLFLTMKNKNLNDIRSVTDSKQTKFIFNRLAHSTFDQKKYV